MISILFFGGWHAPFPEKWIGLQNWPPLAAHLWALLWMLIKIVFWFFMIAMAKAIVPRYRYDQLMRLGWKVFLPTSMAAVVIIAAWRVFSPWA
jgi:NADH-quinone oxidoreductase subunit H